MLRVLKAYFRFLLLVCCALLPACFVATGNSEPEPSSSSSATKSAYLIFTNASLQSDTADISSESSSYIFTDTIIDSTRSITFTLTNTGDVPAKITSAPQLDSPYMYTGGNFPGTGGNCKKIISPAEDCTISVDFTPETIGNSRTSYRLIYNNGKKSRTFEKVFIGKGVSDPKITSITPSFGPTAGGTTITVQGTQLFTGAAVTIGGRNCIASYTPPTVLTCVIPAGTLGAADVKITNTDNKTVTLTSGFTYVPPPTVTAITPTAGALAGGTSVTITGTGFYSGVTASVGGVNCASATYVSSTSMTCVTGAHAASTTSVIVTNADFQSGTGTNLYTYEPSPTVTSVSPTAGALAGGTSITITGTNFLSGATVTVGGVTCASPTVNSVSSITCTTGAHAAGSTDVVVTNFDTQSGTGTGLYTYQSAPTVTGVGPSRIYLSGRTITLTGTGFLAAATATVNGVACSSPVVNSTTSLTCTAPATAAGLYSLTVTNFDNQSGTLTNGLTYADNDVWIPTTTTGAPSARRTAATVWTGSKMIMFAGWPWSNFNVVGSSFDPVTDSWSPINTTGVNGINEGGNSSVWTGKKMIVWGGYGENYGVGNLYDPATDTWTAMTTTNAPTNSVGSAYVWTGAKLLVWSGSNAADSNAGGIYDPEANTWSVMNVSGAPPARRQSKAVWTGSKMLVWGGFVNASSTLLNDGGIYDLSLDSWSGITTTGAPTARRLEDAYWTGSKMLVWGGGYNTGGLYDPQLNSWTITSTTNAGAPRFWNISVWTGSKMIVWGGVNGAANTGGIFDPILNSWTLTTTDGAPSAITNQAAGIGVGTGYGTTTATDLNGSQGVWTGGRMIAWGGSNYADSTVVNTGGMYIPPTDPASNTWTAMTTTGAPSPRGFSSQTWTGSKLIAWSGLNGSTYYNDGGVYDLVTNSWTSMPTTNAPEGRRDAMNVWTGNKMLVWSGRDNTTFYNTGGSYDPSSNTWSNLSTTNAPTSRCSVSGVWTGSKMIAFGGWDGSTKVNTGGVYNPDTDTWTSMSTTNAAVINSNQFSGNWTGSKYLVWSSTSAGRIYDPTTNTWSLMTTVNAPAWHDNTQSVWTGSKFIVWGGQYSGNTFNDGGMYDLSNNTWTSVSTVNAPAGRYMHYTVWTGSRMIIFGGFLGSAATNTGGIFDPETNTWTSTTTTSAPNARYHYFGDGTAWTGGKIIIFGGTAGGVEFNTGGIYTP